MLALLQQLACMQRIWHEQTPHHNVDLCHAAASHNGNNDLALIQAEYASSKYGSIHMLQVAKDTASFSHQVTQEAKESAAVCVELHEVMLVLQQSTPNHVADAMPLSYI
ncbi:TPA: hypothetical protein ACH3X2_008126 [Trebouxia sp. C0005]